MGFTIPFTATEITAFKDIVLACAAIGTVYYARKGINKWHDETKGNASFDLAKNLLELTYVIQREMAVVRNPVHYSYELNLDGVDTSDYTKAEVRMYGMLQLYKNRYTDLLETLTKAKASSIEVATLWSTKESKKVYHLIDLTYELLTITQEYASTEMDISELEADLECGGVDHDSIVDEIKALKSKMAVQKTIACRPLNKTRENEFCKRINAAVKGIEDIAKKHLKTK